MEGLKDAGNGGGVEMHCTHGSLTSSYGWFIQGILATLAFACLAVKRSWEPQGKRRTWTVWFFDTSKQAIGSLVIHFINIVIAELFEGPDPCTQYIISFLLDSSLGLLVIYLGIRLTQLFATQTGCDYLMFGEYGKPRPKARYWLFQSLAYVFIVIVAKIVVTLLLQLKFWDHVRDLLLWPIPSPELEVALVVLIIPFIVNVFMFWVTDNFLIMHRIRGSKSDLSANSVCTAFRGLFTFRPQITCCWFKKREEDDSDLLEVTFEHNQQSMTTSQA